MICPMVEQAHFGTTRYKTLSLCVIQVPGKPMYRCRLGNLSPFGTQPGKIYGEIRKETLSFQLRLQLFWATLTKPSLGLLPKRRK